MTRPDDNVIQLPQALKKGKSPPRRPKNEDVRSREFLYPGEVARMIKAAKRKGRHRHRDATLILTLYRHGFRRSEVVALRRDQYDLNLGVVHVKRRKRGLPSTHTLTAAEIRAMRRLFREYPGSPFVFITERRAPMTVDNVYKIVSRAGELAGLPFRAHPHMLRHATGFKLVNSNKLGLRDVQVYLGHKNIQNTVVYTQLDASRFEDIWED